MAEPANTNPSVPLQEVGTQTPRCWKCLYPLTGLTAPRCPECGTAFDPADRRTYVCGSLFRLKALRAARRWLPILLLVSSLGYGLVQLQWYYGAVEAGDICTICGVRADTSETWLFGHRVWSRRHAPAATAISDFLGGSTTDHPHNWRCVSRQHRDWWGPIRAQAAGFTLSRYWLADFTVGSLQHAAERLARLGEEEAARDSRLHELLKDPLFAGVPVDDWSKLLARDSAVGTDLKELIRRGILQEPDLGRAWEHMFDLCGMCRARDDEHFRMYLDVWLMGSASEEWLWAAAMENEIGLRYLHPGLKDQQASARQQAARELGLLGDRRALPELEEAARDDDPAVREAAILAIARIDPGARLAPIRPSVKLGAGVAGVIVGSGLWLGSALGNRKRRKRAAALSSLVGMQ